MVEEGSHEELMQRGAEGAYHSLVALQAAASTADTDVAAAAAAATVPTAHLGDVIRADADLALAAAAEAFELGVSQRGDAGTPGSARNQRSRRTSKSAAVAVAAEPAPTTCTKGVTSKSG